MKFKLRRYFTLTEAKADIQAFVDKFGQDTYDLFIKSKDRLKNNKLSTDIVWHTAHTSPEEMDSILSTLQRKMGNKDMSNIDFSKEQIPGKYKYYGRMGNYDVYEPLDYIASMALGVNTGWCTTGRYGHYGDPNFKPDENATQSHFNDYTRRGIRLIYLLDPKTHYGEYAVAIYPKPFEVGVEIPTQSGTTALNGTNFEIFNAKDYRIWDLGVLPTNFIDKFDLYIDKETFDIVDFDTTDVQGITLLSVDEARELPKAILRCGDSWWLRTPATDNYRSAASAVMYDGFVTTYGYSVDEGYHKVRPALVVSAQSLNPGARSIIEVFDHQWYYQNGLALLMGEPLTNMAFRKDWTAADATDYEKSDVKKWLDNWFAEQKAKYSKNESLLKESVEETDSEGNPLSPEQVAFFKNSVMRDGRGNLLVCYHGSPTKGITAFWSHIDPQFFSRSLGYAKEYMLDRDTGEPGDVYSVYLNITNPFDNSTKEMNDFLINEFVPWCEKKGYKIPDEEALKHSPVNFAAVADNLYVFLRKMFREGKSRWDGMFVDEYYVKEHGEDAKTSYVPLFGNQIKAITNKKPSNSNNINEGTSGESSKQKTINRQIKRNVKDIARQLDAIGGVDCKFIVDSKSMTVHHINDVKTDGLKDNSFENLWFICSDDSRNSEVIHKLLHYMDRNNVDYKDLMTELEKVNIFKYDPNSNSFTRKNIKDFKESVESNNLDEVYPDKGESKDDFIKRFMSVTKDEYPDTKQRYAVANSYWERRNKKEGLKMSKVNIREEFNRRDYDEDNKYDLYNTFKSAKLNESAKQKIAQMLAENKSSKLIYGYMMKEGKFGGAYDLEDDAYFSREELDEFADMLNDYLGNKVEVAKIYWNDNNHMEIDIHSDEWGDQTIDQRVDMRKVKILRDLWKYVRPIQKQVYDAYPELFEEEKGIRDEMSERAAEAVEAELEENLKETGCKVIKFITEQGKTGFTTEAELQKVVDDPNKKFFWFSTDKADIKNGEVVHGWTHDIDTVKKFLTQCEVADILKGGRGKNESLLKESSLTIDTYSRQIGNDPDHEIAATYEWEKGNYYNVFVGEFKDSMQLGAAIFNRNYPTEEAAKRSFQRWVRKIKAGELGEGLVPRKSVGIKEAVGINFDKALLDKWIDDLNASDKNYYNTYAYTMGDKYIRVYYTTSGAEYVFAFVDADGNIYKPAGWRTPAKGVRARIDRNPPMTDKDLYSARYKSAVYGESVNEAYNKDSLHSKLWNMEHKEQTCFQNGYCVTCYFHDGEGMAKRYTVTNRDGKKVLDCNAGFAWQPQIQKFEDSLLQLLNTGSIKEEILTEKPSPDGYEPTKKGIAYKVFKVKNGKLYPPMVANAGGADTPVGVWLDAEEGEFAGLSKTGRPQVKSTGSGNLSYRPGWHLGDIPRAKQFDRLNKETGEYEFPKDFVWAECEYAMDVDYQPESDARGYERTKVDKDGNVITTKSDKYQHSLAGLPKLPTNGYYKYRTNPNPDTVPWVITGQMKVKRLLSDAEVNAILEKNGIEPIHRQGGDKTLAELGLN